MSLYAAIWSILFLGAWAIIYRDNNGFGIVYLFLIPIPIIIFTVITKIIIDKFVSILPVSRIDFDIEKYCFPDTNSKEVGITIKNYEKSELTNIYISLIELRLKQFISKYEDRSVIIKISKANRNFDYGRDATIEKEKTIILGEIRNGTFYLLLGTPIDPKEKFKDQISGISMPGSFWELKFKLSGELNGHNFKEEIFLTKIDVEGTTINIGNIIHVRYQN